MSALSVLFFFIIECSVLAVLVFYYKGILEQAPVVWKVDNTIHRINHYPADSVVCFVNTYALDSDLSGG